MAESTGIGIWAMWSCRFDQRERPYDEVFQVPLRMLKVGDSLLEKRLVVYMNYEYLYIYNGYSIYGYYIWILYIYNMIYIYMIYIWYIYIYIIYIYMILYIYDIYIWYIYIYIWYIYIYDMYIYIVTYTYIYMYMYGYIIIICTCSLRVHLVLHCLTGSRYTKWEPMVRRLNILSHQHTSLRTCGERRKLRCFLGTIGIDRDEGLFSWRYNVGLPSDTLVYNPLNYSYNYNYHTL